MQFKISYSNATLKSCRYNPYSAAKLTRIGYFLAIDLIAHLPYCNIIIKACNQRIAELGSNCSLYSF